MNVVLFGATGNIAAAIAEELVVRGHQVKGITRSGSVPGRARAGIELERGDATDAAGVAGWVQGYDVVVSAIGPAFGSGEPQPFVATAHGLAEGVRTAGIARLLVVGGAGSLELAPGVQAVDQPGFPEAYKANALAQREALEFYRPSTTSTGRTCHRPRRLAPERTSAIISWGTTAWCSPRTAPATSATPTSSTPSWTVSNKALTGASASPWPTEPTTGATSSPDRLHYRRRP
jgi:putative NADH-flavin reductase